MPVGFAPGGHFREGKSRPVRYADMMFTLSRRAALAGLSATVALPAVLHASAPSDFAIDWQGATPIPDLLAALRQQIALVKALRIKPEIARFFADQVITINTDPTIKTRAGPRGIFFQRTPLPPPDNPVLLHELLHRYQLERLPDGRANKTVNAFYDKAKARGDWPPQAYLYTNSFEFYAMVASVTLYGRAARPPYTRALVQAKLPDMYRWIVEDFGLQI